MKTKTVATIAVALTLTLSPAQAHLCNEGLVHIPGNDHVSLGGHWFGIGGKDGRGHTKPSKCEHQWKIDKCNKAGRVINLWADSNNQKQSVDQVCGDKCPEGTTPGKHDYANACVHVE